MPNINLCNVFPSKKIIYLLIHCYLMPFLQKKISQLGGGEVEYLAPMMKGSDTDGRGRAGGTCSIKRRPRAVATWVVGRSAAATRAAGTVAGEGAVAARVLRCAQQWVGKRWHSGGQERQSIGGSQA
jgi:hypothetical protein